MDFAARAPAEKAAATAWLGPAVAELLQAKMQLFGGARVLERTRLRMLLAAAGRGAAAGEDELPALAGILPAKILIAGSVSISPGEGPTRISVQARAFETETSKIVSEAVFSAMSPAR